MWSLWIVRKLCAMLSGRRSQERGLPTRKTPDNNFNAADESRAAPQLARSASRKAPNEVSRSIAIQDSRTAHRRRLDDEEDAGARACRAELSRIERYDGSLRPLMLDFPEIGDSHTIRDDALWGTRCHPSTCDAADEVDKDCHEHRVYKCAGSNISTELQSLPSFQQLGSDYAVDSESAVDVLEQHQDDDHKLDEGNDHGGPSSRPDLKKPVRYADPAPQEVRSSVHDQGSGCAIESVSDLSLPPLRCQQQRKTRNDGAGDSNGGLQDLLVEMNSVVTNPFANTGRNCKINPHHHNQKQEDRPSLAVDEHDLFQKVDTPRPSPHANSSSLIARLVNTDGQPQQAQPSRPRRRIRQAPNCAPHLRPLQLSPWQRFPRYARNPAAGYPCPSTEKRGPGADDYDLIITYRTLRLREEPCLPPVDVVVTAERMARRSVTDECDFEEVGNSCGAEAEDEMAERNCWGGQLPPW